MKYNLYKICDYLNRDKVLHGVPDDKWQIGPGKLEAALAEGETNESQPLQEATLELVNELLQANRGEVEKVISELKHRHDREETLVPKACVIGAVILSLVALNNMFQEAK